MFYAQQALISHLITSNLVPTVKGYAGEISDADKLTDILPACLVMFIGGTLAGLNPTYQFDCLIVTDSDAFDLEAELDTNLLIASQFASYLAENRSIVSNFGCWLVDIDQIEGEILLQDDRFTLVALHLVLGEL